MLNFNEFVSAFRDYFSIFHKMRKSWIFVVFVFAKFCEKINFQNESKRIEMDTLFIAKYSTHYFIRFA